MRRRRLDPRAVESSGAALSRLAPALVCGVGLMSAGCYFGPDGRDDNTTIAVTDGGDFEGSSGGDETPIDDDEDEEAPPAYGPTGLRLLTPSQYQNSVRDVLGDVEAQAVGQWRSSIAAAQGGLSSAAVENYEEASVAVTAALFADEQARLDFAGCTPSGSPADPCAASVVTSAGLRAWRRPLTQEEVERYTQLAAEVTALLDDDPWRGLQHAVAGLLQSPNFLYRVELGAPVDPAEPLYVRFDAYELASRISYLVWNTTPDAELLDAAERGELDDPAGFDAQVERLLDSPRSRDGIVQLFVDMFNLDTLYSLQKDEELLPAFTPTIGPAMRVELEQVIEDTVLTQGDLRRLFDTRGGYVNAELAALYGIEGEFGDDFVPVTLPETRGGLLTLPGFLAINSGEASTSPTLRGLTINEMLLCQNIPPPPPDVVPDLPEPGDDEPKTKRELLEQHVSDEACASCHKFTDAIGLALEHYDALGGYRATDNGLTIDPSGEFNGVAFNDAIELGELFADDDRITNCVVRHLYRYATGHVEQPEEQLTIAELYQELIDSGYDLTTAVDVMVHDEGFRFATLSPEDTP